MTDSVFCLNDPWPTTIPLTRPATGSDGIFSLVDDHIAYSRTTVAWMSDRGQRILQIIPIGGSTQTNTKYCVSRAKVVDDALERAWLNESITSTFRKAYRMTDWMENGKSSTLGSARCRFKSLRRVETKVEIKRRGQRQATLNVRTMFSESWLLEMRPT